MAVNPFDDPNGEFHVLVNAEEQRSLWPAFLPVPAGWEVEHGPSARQEALDHIEANWLDLRPKSLSAPVSAAAAQDDRAS
ncbi:MbtH family protein [Pseudonocardia xishanensis]|uniref:MbtH family protein n=1 Tax=Pseudonocardia xishanensis TaxID=630995 RepID=A0ABP8S0J9_9PSEU